MFNWTVTTQVATPPPLTNESAKHLLVRSRESPALHTLAANIVPQEEGSRLHGDLELAVEAIKFGVSSRRVRVDTVAVIDVHDHIHASAIGEKFTEVARVVFRLLEALLDELPNHTTAGCATGKSVP